MSEKQVNLFVSYAYMCRGIFGGGPFSTPGEGWRLLENTEIRNAKDVDELESRLNKNISESQVDRCKITTFYAMQHHTVSKGATGLKILPS